MKCLEGKRGIFMDPAMDPFGRERIAGRGRGEGRRVFILRDLSKFISRTVL
jgi:hypothetical protein